MRFRRQCRQFPVAQMRGEAQSGLAVIAQRFEQRRVVGQDAAGVRVAGS